MESLTHGTGVQRPTGGSAPIGVRSKTALHYALRGGAENIRVLLEFGADVNAQARNGYNGLWRISGIRSRYREGSPQIGGSCHLLRLREVK
ncbi:MAG: hypothetical protein ACOX48_03090 [Limnochordia bacterium]